ncbi:DUF6880 family protein [Gordonia sp. ABSL49_1]|uniref:DUF6880 family protein n=1 Tax=Gordonia sp. ABSL49_1 TaxID=2920941 RepID=UPI001F11437A|nr:DUF6880 family protein [Gordonia sp. ABSL49_1]MCH5642262.1 hypothetical protein [Gordonia sp. ABSL49_1]
MTELADTVLPLIRTRADLHRWRAADAHGGQMHEAVDILEEAATGDDPADVFAVTQKALASSLTLIMRADDSSGIIGGAIRRLLALHPTVAERAGVAPAKLVDWMIDFQFHNRCDFFTIDPVAYAPALGDVGMARYRTRLDAIRAGISPPPPPDDWRDPDRHERSRLEYNDRRLAVFDRDLDAVIRTHARDQKRAAWLEDTAEALAEIGEYDLAIDWAHRASLHDQGHQALTASETWCNLLAAHRPEDLLAARTEVFRRWPSSTTASRLYGAAGDEWSALSAEVTATLSDQPRDAVAFSLFTLDDPRRAWEQARALRLSPDDSLWLDLIKRYEKIDKLAVLDPLVGLVDAELEYTGVGHYKAAARHLKRMRTIAKGTDRASSVDELIADLREDNRRRPRLQQEFDKAGLP